MAELLEYHWQPIQDLPDDWESLKDAELHSLMTAWQEQSQAMRRGESYNEFLVRLKREWAIETGQIERLYDISRGATKTLIEQGFDAALLSHDDTDRPTEEVLDYIKDQHNAIEGLYQFVGGDRPLGTSYVKELHKVLTAHQSHYHARNTLGHQVLTELPRGTWKTVPNNVELGNGKIFEFCPYEHVDAEMDQLIAWHHSHEEKGVLPEIESAWLHHRFTLIHPFCDGNGRVARCLASLVLLKHRWFPLVVTRDDRGNYLSAIREADRGKLASLVSLFGALQKRAIKRAMSLGEEVERGAAAIGTILDLVKTKIYQDRTPNQKERAKVFTFADDLWQLACEKLDRIAQRINSSIADPSHDSPAYTDSADRNSDRSDYYRYQIFGAAKELEYRPSLNDYRAWARLVIVMDTQVEVLFSFHGIGGEFKGVLVCVGMAYTKRKTEQANEITELKPLSDEPFYFAYNDPLGQVHDRFSKWIDEALVEGLDYWRKAIGA